MLVLTPTLLESFQRVWISVDGTRIKFPNRNTANAGRAEIILKAFNTGNIDKAHPDALEYFGFTTEDAASLSDADARTALTTLNFLS